MPAGATGARMRQRVGVQPRIARPEHDVATSPDLEHDYEAAWREWEATGEEAAWRVAAARLHP